MDDWLKIFWGEEGEPDDESSGNLSSGEALPPDDITATPPQAPKPAKDSSGGVDYAALFEKEWHKLLSMARAIIRFACSDPQAHGKDVVQSGFLKVLQTPNVPRDSYEHAFRSLRMAVRQTAQWHTRICLREKAVDLNKVPRARTDSAEASPDDREDKELQRKISIDPSELYMSMIGISEMFAKLDETDRDVAVMRFIEGCTLHEIAERIGGSTSAVQRALVRIKKELGIHDDGEAPGADDGGRTAADD